GNYYYGPAQIKGLLVQLPIFHGKERENVITWLLQVDLLFKARKVESIEEEDKILNFVKGLKLATKAKVSYRVSESLENAM
ncbi:16926_t:CDS:2, partial [Dentiscutata heterogama]